nr:T9SS sorting signal type C domain-containing protein [uncultured Flavobacterium sp.]
MKLLFYLNLRITFFRLLFLFFIPFSYSQQGKIDATFNTYDDGLLGDGFDNTVRTLCLQPDGKLIVGGDYLNFNGALTSYLSRLYPDGSKDTTFDLGSGFNGKIYTSIIQPDGKILLGGSFTTFNGANASRLIRLNADGSIDASFNTAIGVNTGIVYDLALQADGNIIVVGSFSKYNGVNANKIARILPNGNLDATFITGSGASATIEEVQIQLDGKIILAGSFDSFNKTLNTTKIVRLDTTGNVDASFISVTGFDATITALELQSDGKILVGGAFTTYNGSSANRIVRLNTDGSVDAGFVSGSGFNNGGVTVIKTNALGEIMVGGSFTGTYNGIDINQLVLLNPNGTLSPNFDIGTGPATATIYDLALDIDGSWYIGGSFSVFDSQNQGRLAKIDASGVLDLGYLTAGVGFDNSVLKVLSLSDTKTMAFGSFTKFNGVSSLRIARLLVDGTLDLTFNTLGSGADGIIRNAIIQSDNKMVLVGSFKNYNGVSANRIIRILEDGSIDPSFIVGTGANNQIYAIALQLDGKILIGGNFTNYNGTLVNRIIRLLPDGTIDASFNVGLGADAIVETVLLQSDGKIVVGGRFVTFNGNSYNHLVRLNVDGSIDAGFSIGTGFDKYVYTIAKQADDKLILGGTFSNYNGVSTKRIVRLNTDGSLDVSFAIGTGFSNGELRTILIQPDGRILAGGTFSGTYNGTIVKRMLRLLPTGVYDNSFLVNLNGTLFSSCFTPSNDVIIGGNFNSVSGITKHRVARIKLCTNSSSLNGTLWTNGPPSGGKELIFHDDYVIANSVNVCSCSIDAGKKVVVSNGKTLGLTFNYIGLGTLILEDSASLYQSDDESINTGIVEVKRKSTPILKFDYTYWSSPVINQKLFDVSPNTLSDKFFSFDTAIEDWITESPSNNMINGKGYIIRGPQDYSTTIATLYEAVFKGVPNNGIVSIPIGATDTSNLIGNPYPSAIDADLFLNKNAGIIDGTIYFWTHNTPITNNIYTSNDYAMYNLLGGVGTSAAINLGGNNSKPNGKIASGQSFFVTSINGGGTAVFNNSMRIVEQNTFFYKSNSNEKIKYSNGIEKHRIWLNLSNTQGAFKQILVGYATAATNQIDRSFDGETFDGNEFLDFYSINQGVNLAIQGRALPFEEKDEIPIGYTTEVEGTFNINIDEIDGLLANQSVYIEDKTTNLIYDLKKEGCSFFTQKGVFNDRFVLRYTNKNLNTNDFNPNGNLVLISCKNQQIKISSLSQIIEKVSIYDLLGRKIYQKKHIDTTETTIYDLALSPQVLIIKMQFQSGKSIAEKILFQ